MLTFKEKTDQSLRSVMKSTVINTRFKSKLIEEIGVITDKCIDHLNGFSQ